MQLITRLASLAAILVVFSLTAAGQTCTFTISPASANFFANGGTGTITMTASAGNCTRTVTSNAAWITISFGQTGTGSGTAGYTVQANNTNVQRTGTIDVAGRLFTVTQAAGTCTYQLSPSSATVAATGGTGSFSVSSGCSWTATSNNTDWLRVTRTSQDTVEYSVDAQTAGTDRTGTITVGTSTFTVRQTAACIFTPTSAIVSATAAGGNQTISVQTRDGCSRIATADVSWITITSGASAEGNGNIGISVSTNNSRDQRIGRILINGATFVTVIQAGSTCVVQLNPTVSPQIPATGGNNLSFAVTANCAWTATTETPWIRIITGASGSGSGTVTYSVGQNLEAQPRTGAITVNGVTFVVAQLGVGCSVDLSDVSVTVPATGGSGRIIVTPMAGCAWTASTSDTWIRVTRTEDEVAYTVEPNPTNRERRGYIVIGGRSVEVVQRPAVCSLAIERSRVQIPAEGARAELAVTANCAWTATSNVGWLQVTGTAPNMLTYSVSPNDSADERSGVITIAQADPPERLTLTVTQNGQRCSVTLSATAASLPARGGNGVVNVTGGTACNWSATSSAGWLQVEWSSVSGSGNIRFSAEANTSGADRSALIAVAGQTITVQQPALVVRLTQAGIVNAASFAGTGVAPGEVITIYGTGFGPAALTTLQLTPNGEGITDSLADTRVLFDGEPSPIVYVIDGQLSAIVPYGVAAKQTVGIQVEYLGVRSNTVNAPVVAAAPGIFTVSATGRGQAAVLNQDYSLNGPANPAERNSIVQIFATGEGQTRPAGVDGKLAVAPLPAPVLPVRVFIGGVEATVTYAGAAPGLVAGVMQVNARVPQELQPGTEVPVVIRVGTADTPAGPTIAVR